jgi:hypothetical protein
MLPVNRSAALWETTTTSAEAPRRPSRIDRASFLLARATSFSIVGGTPEPICKNYNAWRLE